MEHKYLKYKKKYLNLKYGSNQFGGANNSGIEFNETILSLFKNKTKNVGQHNCGIVQIENYFIKCINIDKQNDEFYKNMYDDLDGLIVKLYKWKSGKYVESYINNYIIMEKLDGDLTSFIFDKILENFSINDQLIYRKYKDHLSQSSRKIMEDEKRIIMSDVENIKIEEIKNSMKNLLENMLPTYQKKLDKLFHSANVKGYEYIDLKLDNIGYKKNGDNINFYFIDLESGMYKLNNIYPNVLHTHYALTPIDELGIYGQSSIKSRFNTNIVLEKRSLKDIALAVNKFGFIEEEYNEFWNYIKIRYPGKNNFFVIQIFGNHLRLVRFDSSNRHMSHKEYETFFESVDELYENTANLYERLRTIIKP